MQAGRDDLYGLSWRWWVLLFWLAASGLLLYVRWTGILWFALGDTDDNMRIMQVRAWLRGQDWFDLRQYRLSPPDGANIHWSRLVDLPIAGLMLLLRPLAGGQTAEKIAVAVAPLLPMLVAMGAVAAAVRRMVAPKAFAFAIALLLCAHSTRSMWAPLRIDHHGWQLALLAVAAASFAVRRPAVGGLLLGLATALSLVIGLEMLLYLAVAGAAVALMWIADPDERPRLLAYGASLAGGCALGFLLFTSYDNRAAVCDALSPVWLSAMVAAGGIAVLLSLLPLSTWKSRLTVGAICGAVLAAGFAFAWPHCLGRLEGVSPELDNIWLSHVREARPVYRHSWQVMANTLSLPVAGLLGYAVMLWRSRRTPRALAPWLVLTALALLAASLLLWQSRAGPAAQLLSVPGVTALGWLAILSLRSHMRWFIWGPAIGGLFFLISGLALQSAVSFIPAAKAKGPSNQANARCPTLASLRPVARQPKGIVLTFLDLNPRLIAVTHHDGIAGPYHRNQQAILDVMKSWRGTAENARRTADKYRADYVLICPGLSESTIYASEAKNGFYMQLVKGKVPDWLQPVDLGKRSPYRMWRIVRR